MVGLEEDESVPIDQIIELVTNQQMIEMEKIMGNNSIAYNEIIDNSIASNKVIDTILSEEMSNEVNASIESVISTLP